MVVPIRRCLMKYQTVSTLEEEAFRRLTGVKRATFNKMTEILRESNKAKKRKGGRNNKLPIMPIKSKKRIEG